MHVDRYDAIRRAWINDHKGWSTIQDRRQNQLDVVVRRRQRIATGAVPNPHDDVVLPPIWLRLPNSSAAQLEWVGVNLIGLLLPVGWPVGWAAHRIVTRAIPATLRAYPIVAMLTAGAVLGLLTVGLYRPGPGLGDIIWGAWIPLQVAAIPTVAGVYGMLDGWLAIPGSTGWWPWIPREQQLNRADAEEILGSYDLTGPGLIPAQALTEDGERRPR